MNRIVTLLTDFGTSDYYVGAVRGVILSVDPTITIVDITHEVPPGGVRYGAFVLAHASRWFPKGTVHCVVVDPGVGTQRRPIVVQSDKGLFVGPDNGVLSLAIEGVQGAWVIERFMVPEGAGDTFHGRDIFAPVAAKLAMGMPPDEVGSRVDDFQRMEWPRAGRDAKGQFRGKVLFEDRFGNLITDVHSEDLGPGQWQVRVAGRRAPVARTFGDVDVGAVVAYPGSAGYLEVAVRNGSASEWLGVGRGAKVVVEPLGDSLAERGR